MVKTNNRFSVGIKLGMLSLITNVVLFVFKYYVGYKDNSLAITADAWHTLSDSISSLILIISVWLSKRPRNDKHPFGYGRIEHLGAIVVGALLFYIGINFIFQAYESFINKEKTFFSIGAWIVTIISIVFKELLARITLKQGKKVNSGILVADAWHHRSDALSSLVILIGLIFNSMFWWIDAVLSLIVSLLILKVAVDIFKSEITSLVGKSASEELQTAIRQALDNNFNTDFCIHHFLLHEYGYHREMSCHITLPPDTSLEKTHEICTNIEKCIEREFEITLTVHPEPISTTKKDTSAKLK
ncbi:MAG: cation diffusion facilitator family transporter [Bacteroidales bacterium]